MIVLERKNEIDLTSNNAFARLYVTVYFDRTKKTFLEVGSDGDGVEKEYSFISVTIEGQHAEASALLVLIQSVIKASADKV